MALSSNARMAINFEHAWGDGVAVVRFLNEVCETSSKDQFTPAQSGGAASGAMSAQKLNFDLDESTKTSIKTGMHLMFFFCFSSYKSAGIMIKCTFNEIQNHLMICSFKEQKIPHFETIESVNSRYQFCIVTV